MPDNFNRSRAADFTLRQDGGDMYIEGYFVVFDQPYYIDADCEETVSPSAFDGCDMADVRALIDHRTDAVLGRTTSDTLTLEIDDTGLFGSIKINPCDSDAVNLHARVQRGDVNQASFGFDEREVRYTDLPDGRVRRTIEKIAVLYEVSVCTFPAYEETCLYARSAAAAAGQIRAELLARKKNKLKRRLHHGITHT